MPQSFQPLLHSHERANENREVLTRNPEGELEPRFFAQTLRRHGVRLGVSGAPKPRSSGK